MKIRVESYNSVTLERNGHNYEQSNHENKDSQYGNVTGSAFELSAVGNLCRGIAG